MKYIAFCLTLCLLMISCSSTPPAESQEDVAPTESMATEVAQPEEATTLEEHPVQDLGNISSEESSSQDAYSETFPVTDFLELQADDLEDVALTEPEYLQEIEIIDIDQVQVPPLDDLEDMAMVMDEPENMVVEPEMALVVETPADELVEPIPEPLPQTDDEMALVVEEVVDTATPEAGELEPLPELSSEQEPPTGNLPEAESQAAGTIMEDGSLLVEMDAAAAPESAFLEQAGGPLEELVPGEAVPIDVNAIQGVVSPVEPSRTVIMDNQQFLDLRYPGNGWVYLGEVTEEGASIGTPNLTYFGRRRTSNDTSFTLRSIKPGSTILHFYKQDVLTATFIDDFVQVTITDKVAQVGSRVIAPNYGSVIPGYQDTVPQPSSYVQAESAQEMLAAAEPEPSDVSEPEVSESVAPSATGMASAPSTDIAPTQTAVPSETIVGNAPIGDTAAPQAQPLVAATDTPPPATTTDTITQAPRVETRPDNAGITATPPDTGTVAAATDQQGSITSAATIANQRDMQAPATGAESGTTNQPQPDTVQSQVGALQVVPPRDSNIASLSPAEPVQRQPEASAARQQEVYQPETSSPVAATPSDYNPQTGMSMENLQLPWVQEELERQRTVDIQAADTTSDTQPPTLEQLEEQTALLAKAQEYFYAEEYPASLDYLNQFFAIAVSDFDAAYYLKGQVLESKSSVRNIKEAQKAYKHVVDSYPQSPFWKRAKNRFTYLSRFYFDIR